VGRVLFEDRFVSVTFDEGQHLVRYVRTREAYPAVDVMNASNAAIAQAVAWVPRGTLKLLLDLRDAPPRNDDDFENAASKALTGFVPTFRAHAVLMRTAVGRLQAQRMARRDGATPTHVFTTEAEALAHLGVK
jgi:hypothetical protein